MFDSYLFRFFGLDDGRGMYKGFGRSCAVLEITDLALLSDFQTWPLQTSLISSTEK